MRGSQRLFVSMRQLFRQWLQRSRITPIMILGFARTILGSRPSQAKSLSLGEYVFLTDFIFLLTLSLCQSIFRPCHCIIHASLFSFSRFLFVCLSSLRKPKKILFFFFCLLGAFPCKQFSFSLGQGRRPWLQCLVALACISVYLLKSHITLSSALCLPTDSNVVQCTSTLIIVHNIRSCK